MFNKNDKNAGRVKRHKRVRAKVVGTKLAPRLCVYRSNCHIYAQLIDDSAQNTVASASTVEKAIIEKIKGKTKTESAFIVGEALGKVAVEKGITKAVFDRAGYIYTGRVQQVAEGARKAGLQF